MGTDTVPVPLAMDLNVCLDIFGAIVWTFNCLTAVVSTETCFSYLGDLNTGEFRGSLHVRPSVTLLRVPFRIRRRCRRIYPSFHPFNQLLGQYPGIYHTKLREAELLATTRRFFAHGSGPDA